MPKLTDEIIKLLNEVDDTLFVVMEPKATDYDESKTLERLQAARESLDAVIYILKAQYETNRT